jgi:parvulin-like peptidyl-prolyl isomerase
MVDKVKTSKGGAMAPRTKGATGRTRTLIAAAIVVLAVGLTAGTAIYRDQVKPFRTIVLIVDDTAVQMRYFLKRARLSGQEPLALLQTLTFEEIIRQVAPKPPYNIKVSDQDVDRALRETARGESATIQESEFAEWYRQQLNESRLSDSQFRDLTRRRLLRLGLNGYLAERVPTVAEQVHLYAITQGAIDEAAAVKARLDAGEDFFLLARELNRDETLRAKGGDLGWHVRGALAPNLARIAFDDLAVGEASEPLGLGDRNFAILTVVERAAAREIQPEALEVIKAKALDEWLAREFDRHHVEYHGFNNGYDSETDAWVKWQLEKMKGKAR